MPHEYDVSVHKCHMNTVWVHINSVDIKKYIYNGVIETHDFANKAVLILPGEKNEGENNAN